MLGFHAGVNISRPVKQYKNLAAQQSKEQAVMFTSSEDTDNPPNKVQLPSTYSLFLTVLTRADDPLRPHSVAKPSKILRMAFAFLPKSPLKWSVAIKLGKKTKLARQLSLLRFPNSKRPSPSSKPRSLEHFSLFLLHIFLAIHTFGAVLCAHIAGGLLQWIWGIWLEDAKYGIDFSVPFTIMVEKICSKRGGSTTVFTVYNNSDFSCLSRYCSYSYAMSSHLIIETMTYIEDPLMGEA